MNRLLWILPACLIPVTADLSRAQPDPLLAIENSSLFFPAASLTTNGIAGLTNVAPHLMVSGVSAVSAQGASVSLVNTQVWERYYNENNSHAASAMVVDHAGNVCVAGESLNPGAGYDLALVKYAGDGTPLWTNRYDGPAHTNDMWWRIAVDGANNVYVAGNCNSGTNDIYGQPYEIVIIKYSDGGIPLWTNRFLPGSFNVVYGFEVDDAGNSHVLASSDGVLTLKFDPSGVPLWTNRFQAGTNSIDGARAMDLGRDGELLVTATSWPRGAWPGWYQGALTRKIAPDGTGVWTNFFALSNSIFGIIEGNAIIVDHAGNVIISGQQSELDDYVQVKFASDGTPLWTNFIAASMCICEPYVPALAVDWLDNVFVLGLTPGTWGDFPDYTVTKLSSDGVLMWTNRFAQPDSPGRGWVRGMAVDNAGNFYLTTRSLIPTNTQLNFATVKIDPNGAAIWTNHWDGPSHGYDEPASVAVDGAGALYITGASSKDSVTLKFVDYVRYTPPPDFTGTDSFSFTVVDNAGTFATNTVTVAVLPPTLRFNTAPANFRFASEGLHLQVDGARGTSPVILHVSLDLLEWHPIATNTPSLGSAVFLDPAASGWPRRFYRATQEW